jgi:ATP-dependent Clp protease ATP-binding subunit ClpA
VQLPGTLASRRAVSALVRAGSVSDVHQNLGQLTEAVRRKPYGAISFYNFWLPRLTIPLAVVLLDELEKAHKVVGILVP